MIKFDETIAAISTPSGTGGIAVLRVSGPTAVEIVDGIFEGKTSLADAETHKANLGKIVDGSTRSNLLDEALVTVFRSPNSYTQEDVVEISCHGGRFLSHKILELLVDRGARIAEPGEFTQRAFLSGRLDLTRAEAVADIISAKTELSLRAALAQFQGALSHRVKSMRQTLVDICSLLELELDFAEEDVVFANKEEVSDKIKSAIFEIEDFLSTYKRGKVLREGVKLVIVGKPNVGKSSLLNALLKEERAIVTDIPGTTRDTIEEQLDIQGVLFRVVDTAGVRETSDRLEKMGVERTLKEIKAADLVLFLFDASGKLDEEDERLISDVFKLRSGSAENGIIGALNKIDLQKRLTDTAVRKHLGDHPVLEISAREHLGFKELEKVFIELSVGRDESLNGKAMITNLRQKQALSRALESLNKAQESMQEGLSSEFVALDLREGLQHLGEIIGEVTTEDILGNIFSRFCIGK